MNREIVFDTTRWICLIIAWGITLDLLNWWDELRQRFQFVLAAQLMPWIWIKWVFLTILFPMNAEIEAKLLCFAVIFCIYSNTFTSIKNFEIYLSLTFIALCCSREFYDAITTKCCCLRFTVLRVVRSTFSKTKINHSKSEILRKPPLFRMFAKKFSRH